MDEQEKLFRDIREIAINNPQKIKIIETSVDPDTQIDFFETLQKTNNDNNSYTIKELENILQNEKNPEIIKYTLAILTTFNDVEAFRLLERYIESAPSEIKKWVFLAYQQSKLFLETYLLDEDSTICIASGLGGCGIKLRYCFAFISKGNLTENQIKTCKGEIEYFFRKNNCELEDFNSLEKFIIGKALIPIYIPVGEFLSHIVNEINNYGDFLEKNVFITNEKIIDFQELKKIFSDGNK